MCAQRKKKPLKKTIFFDETRYRWDKTPSHPLRDRFLNDKINTEKGKEQNMEVEITDQNYTEYLSQDKPMIIDFWAVWCGPCKRMSPIVEALAQKYDGRVIVGKVDVDENPEITAKYGIRNIPTILYISGGEVVDKTVGAVPAASVEQKIEALL